MKNTLETRLGVFFALTLLAAALILEMLGGGAWFKGGHHVRALFSNAQELKAGDPVKMAGVIVGAVQKVALTEDKVEVTLKLYRDAVVRTDSKATIRFQGLMGQNYVSISFGQPNAPIVEENGLIASAEQPDLNAIMTKLDNVASGIETVTKSFSGENFSHLLAPFTDFMKENNPKLTAILGNIQAITTQISDGKGTVGELVKDDALYKSALATVTNFNATALDVRGVVQDAKGVVQTAKDVMAGINEGRGTAGKLVKDDTLYKETTTAATNLKEILQKINRGQGAAGKLVNDESLYNGAKLSLQKADKLMDSLEDTGPLSVVGVLANKLF